MAPKSGKFQANLGPKIQSCLFCLKIGPHGISKTLILIPTLVLWIWNPNFLFRQIWAEKVKVEIDTHGIWEVQIPNPDLDFWNSDLKIHYWANLGWKSQSCPYFLKTGTHGILMMLILIPTLFFWISDPKYFLGKIWTKKVNVSRQCWFLFRHYFSQFPTLNPFLDKFGSKNSNLFILTKNWHTWYIEDADPYSDNIFLNCQP